MTFPPTARLAMACMLALVFAYLMAVFWRQDRRQVALAEWSLACLLIAIAVPIRLAADLIPAWLSIGASNACIFLAFGGFWSGARRFRGAAPSWPVRLGGVVLWLLLVPLVLDDLRHRFMILSLILGSYSLLVAWEFSRSMRDVRLSSHPPLIGVFAAMGLLALIRAGLAWRFGFEFLAPDNLPSAPWNDVLAIAMLATFAGIAVMLVALARESAEQQTAARLTEARDQADAANRNKTRFLARMSHELRTPLNAVFGMAQVLARDPALSPAQRAQATTLVEAGRHLLAIVNDSLDLARVEAGRLDLSPQPIALHDTLSSTLDLLAAAAADKHLDLRLEISGMLPPLVLADPLRLRQIVMNLLGNAIKFTPIGGEAVLGARWDAAAASLCITVRDTGPGVPAEVREALFGEFIQGRQQAGEGTGLGLAISAALAQAMGGALTYAPAMTPSGSLFTLTLPLALPAVREPGRPLRLLVVDDVLPNRLVARALLEQAGHAVTEAGDGSGALAALQAGPPPDAVLMDVNMAPMDGHAATRRIRGLGGCFARLPVIAMTADVDAADLAACREAGMDGHVAKPIDRTALLAELARVTAHV
jgi:signal transduction histidine kinase/ActR/RegA family two-component response regulator